MHNLALFLPTGSKDKHVHSNLSPIKSNAQKYTKYTEGGFLAGKVYAWTYGSNTYKIMQLE